MLICFVTTGRLGSRSAFPSLVGCQPGRRGRWDGTLGAPEGYRSTQFMTGYDGDGTGREDLHVLWFRGFLSRAEMHHLPGPIRRYLRTERLWWVGGLAPLRWDIRQTVPSPESLIKRSSAPQSTTSRTGTLGGTEVLWGDGSVVNPVACENPVGIGSRTRWLGRCGAVRHF